MSISNNLKDGDDVICVSLIRYEIISGHDILSFEKRSLFYNFINSIGFDKSKIHEHEDERDDLENQYYINLKESKDDINAILSLYDL